jgi:hypothetical protein
MLLPQSLIKQLKLCVQPIELFAIYHCGTGDLSIVDSVDL